MSKTKQKNISLKSTTYAMTTTKYWKHILWENVMILQSKFFQTRYNSWLKYHIKHENITMPQWKRNKLSNNQDIHVG